MLVLSRKVGECIVVADEIVIQVLGVEGCRIRLGIKAPPDVAVWREELAGAREPVAACHQTVRKPR
jgi:carbon storage regulator